MSVGKLVDFDMKNRPRKIKQLKERGDENRAEHELPSNVFFAIFGVFSEHYDINFVAYNFLYSLFAVYYLKILKLYSQTHAQICFSERCSFLFVCFFLSLFFSSFRSRFPFLNVQGDIGKQKSRFFSTPK